jgi:predicted metal-dependent hydrolase
MSDTSSIVAALVLVRIGQAFEAHELLEELWRSAAPDERDLYQGCVHVAVAAYQDARGNAVGRTRQLEKALRRLEPYAPVYEGLQIDQLLGWARESLAAGRCRPLPSV